MVKHMVLIKMGFIDKDLFKKYLNISKEILAPSLKSQINKNFEIGCIIKKEDISFVKELLDVDFINFSCFKDGFDYMKENNINIQTRHDMDDYMSPEYIQKIQEEYQKNIDLYDNFLIQAQPVKMMYETKKEFKMMQYNDKMNSMFLSLCQKDVKNYILERNHGQMHEIASHVITLPEGYTKWVIHENNISVRRVKK